MATYILGTGGHARAIAEIYHSEMRNDNPALNEEDRVIIGVGDIKTRVKLYEMYESRVSNIRALDAQYSGWRPGLQLMKGAIVSDSAKLGANVLVNTGAQIDHDCVIGDHCVISPGAILCGGVVLGKMCYISAGAVILQGVELADETYVPPGAVVYGQDDFRLPQRVVCNK